MSKLVKADTAISPANNFASKIEEAIAGDKIAPTRPLLTNCPACGSANMNDPQAQFVGACSARCAKQLGVSEEVLRASGSVPPALLPTAITCGIEIRMPTGNQRCVLTTGHAGDHFNGGGVGWTNKALSVRVESDDYEAMEDVIYYEWDFRFRQPGYAQADADRAVRAAIKRARFIAVKPTADIEVSECGCIWVMQTTYAIGSGDVILRNCDKHAGDLA